MDGKGGTPVSQAEEGTSVCYNLETRVEEVGRPT